MRETKNITHQEFRNALRIVKAYSEQLNQNYSKLIFGGINYHGRVPIDAFLYLYDYKVDVRLYNRLMVASNRVNFVVSAKNADPNKWTYIDEINKKEYLAFRNAGLKTWNKLETLLKEFREEFNCRDYER
jgi:hypothetical protein